MIVQPRRARPRRAVLALAATAAIWTTIAGVSCSNTTISDATTAWPATTFSVGTVLLLLALGAWPWLVQLPLRRTAATRHHRRRGARWHRHPALRRHLPAVSTAGVVAVTAVTAVALIAQVAS